MRKGEALGMEEDDGVDVAWYCLRAKVKREHIAAARVRAEAGLECFAPVMVQRKKTARGVVRFREAMFPGYFFVHCSLRRHMRQVQSTGDVSGFLRYGTRVPSLPPGFVNELREACGDQEVVEVPVPVLAVGTPVVVTAGPFKGLETLLSGECDGKGRVEILLTILGRTLATRIPVESVETETERTFHPLLRDAGHGETEM